MIRLFTALKIPQSLRQQITSLPEKGLNYARFQHPDDLHITLRFIGEAPEERVNEIAEILEGVRVTKFNVIVKGLNIFKKKNQAVLYAPVESVKKITNLNSEITERLQKTGFIFTEQFYTPHVTIARMKDSAGAEKCIATHQKTVFAEWKAESFFLFQSANAQEGEVRYKILREYKLKEF